MKHQIDFFLNQYKWGAALGFFLGFLVLLLIWLEWQQPGVLNQKIYPLAVALSSVCLAILAYLGYRLQQPGLSAQVLACHKNTDLGRQFNITSETGFCLIVLVSNTGYRVINPMSIETDQRKNLYLFHRMNKKKQFSNQQGDMFGCVLKEGERYTDVQALNTEHLNILRTAKRLSVVDIREQRYPLPIKKLKQQQQHIETFLKSSCKG